MRGIFAGGCIGASAESGGVNCGGKLGGIGTVVNKRAGLGDFLLWEDESNEPASFLGLVASGGEGALSTLTICSSSSSLVLLSLGLLFNSLLLLLLLLSVGSFSLEIRHPSCVPRSLLVSSSSLLYSPTSVFTVRPGDDDDCPRDSVYSKK